MVVIDESKCIGCGKCARDCVAQRITVEDNKAKMKRDCILCGHCVAVCPSNAICIPEYDMEDVQEHRQEDAVLNPDTLLHSIKFRRSIRDYKQMPVEQEKLVQIMQAGRYTATAKNNQDCHFVFVQQELDTLKEMVWGYIEEITSGKPGEIPTDMLPFLSFNRRRKVNPCDDYLFRNAPVVLFITSEWLLDGGLAAQNMELMAAAQGLGVLFNGYLARIADQNKELKEWLGIPQKTIKACMLLGYPNVTYARTAPRKEANVVWK